MDERNASALLSLIARQASEIEKLREELKWAHEMIDYERRVKNERLENHG